MLLMFSMDFSTFIVVLDGDGGGSKYMCTKLVQTNAQMPTKI